MDSTWCLNTRTAPQLQRTNPLPQLEEFFFQRAHEPFRVHISFEDVVGGEGLRDTQCR